MVRRFRQIRRITMATTLMEADVRECIEKGRCRLEIFHRTDMDCTMFTATYGSGWRIVGTTDMRVLRRMEEHGQQEGIAIDACCVAVAGTALRGTFALRIATVSRQGTEATSADLLPGRLHRESSSLPRGSKGQSPLADPCGLGEDLVSNNARVSPRLG